MSQTNTTAPPQAASRLRDAMVNTLITAGTITTPAVERAFLTVPRHLFLPAGTSLEAAYAPYRPVTLTDARAPLALASPPSASVAARRIEQAQLHPGMTVAEIGTDGLNAALLAEIVGPGGHVLSIDTNTHALDQAHRLLAATGYDDQVTLLHADRHDTLPALGHAADVILVTELARSIPPAWLEQLAADGRLVLPLQLGPVTATVAFIRDGDHLTSTSVTLPDLLPSHTDTGPGGRVVVLAEHGGDLTLAPYPEPEPWGPASPAAADDDETIVWTNVIRPDRHAFAELYLWLACWLPSFRLLSPLFGPGTREWQPFGAAGLWSHAYLIAEPSDGGYRLGAHPNSPQATAALTAEIHRWDDTTRHTHHPTYTYWPTGTNRPPDPETSAVALTKHGKIVISWPPAS
ncbi:methyltransferase, FxLD system [Frankia sp. AgB1.9]|uniref:methyltransferase, FxLD system n=1 Tax=unclassified Frankia TaxID=2632575 RepID=UPI0019348EA5|nr:MULTISPECIES: methyltransferase, FxLD system [unclassified Frankia]MBL7489722.1 methyltransferase, FxLD system [Frankia sp. AgW1.1]MBL7551932.1 methyltransferase, FxLD system [Frankia sp. AgB1.9]MBL7623229.1 methyltransferase, FxLD system [Frankia sp. AgB1.8]